MKLEFLYNVLAVVHVIIVVSLFVFAIIVASLFVYAIVENVISMQFLP